MALPRRDSQYHTYAELRTWPEDVRYELIDGVAYAMNAPRRIHQKLLLELAVQVRQALAGSPCEAYIAPFEVRLPKGDEADDAIDTVVQPDLSVICDRTKLDEQGCRGAPDWVVEVLSPATAGHDHIVKRSLYQRAGVREFWLVHPDDRLVTIYRLVDGAYGRPDVSEMTGELRAGILPQVAIDWAQVDLT
jgi:Uma2 family endonuclease